MQIVTPRISTVAPLDLIQVRDIPSSSTIRVTDGKGAVYFQTTAVDGSTVEFRASGFPGTHRVEARLPDGSERFAEFALVAATQVKADAGPFSELFTILRDGLLEDENIQATEFRGKSYRYYCYWVRDHVHTMKGMRYLDRDNGPILDLFQLTQREDGLIWDNMSKSQDAQFWHTAYGPHDYARAYDDLTFVRMPVESDVEYLYVEGVHRAWMSSGDDEWMAGKLDTCIRALRYSLESPARWSDKYQLVKRPFTIDTWDFTFIDQYLEPLGRWGRLLNIPGVSKQGVMFGDNTGVAASCRLLAEMLAHAGRNKEAGKYSDLADTLLERTLALCWNGRHFLHYVEEEELERDLGVNPLEQVSLSNAYSANRRIGDDCVRSLVNTYRTIGENLPEGSPGEWYGIYPPFRKGYYGDAEPWQYVNGGVLPLVAGEIAKAAFEVGEEAYGVHVLRQVHGMAKRSGDRVRFAYTGAFPSLVQSYRCLDLRAAANAHHGKGDEATPSFMKGDSGDDLALMPVGRHQPDGIPFEIADSPRNSILIGRNLGLGPVELPLEGNVPCLFLMHAGGAVGSSGVAAYLTWVYEDGEVSRALRFGLEADGWWYVPNRFRTRKSCFTDRFVTGLAWQGHNDISTSVGLIWCGLENPRPDATLKAVRFDPAPDGASYQVVAITAGEQPLGVPADFVSHGGPDNWSAAAVMFALVDGLAGYQETKPAMEELVLSPRWASTEVKQAHTVVHLPASDTYIAYDWHWEPDRPRLSLTLAGSGSRVTLRVLLPEGFRPTTVEVDGVPQSAAIDPNEERYAVVVLDLHGVTQVVMLDTVSGHFTSTRGFMS